jgi:ABC-2 type transport system permease protein
MRAVMFEHRFPLNHLIWAAGLDILYLAGGGLVFLIYMREARRRGALMQMGE